MRSYDFNNLRSLFQIPVILIYNNSNGFICIINSQPLNIQEYFHNQPIWTLSEYGNNIFYKEEIKFGTDFHNAPTYTITNYDFFMAFLKLLIEKKFEEIYQNEKS